jgi:chitin synthase
MVLSFYLVKNAFTGGTLDFSLDDGVGQFLKSFFSSSGAGIVLIALVSTYGIYFLASFMYMDPWHMFTSSWAYFAGMTCSINILMVYAFCNWHDVSWGTKGSDKGDSLPDAETKKDDAKSNFIEEVDKPQADIDSQFESTVKRALEPYVVPEEQDERSMDDGYKAFRTNLVLIWIFSNLILVLCITSEGITRFCLTVCSPSMIQWHILIYLYRTLLPSVPPNTSPPFCGRPPVCRFSALLDLSGSWPSLAFCAVSPVARSGPCQL